jgi:cathepsin L
MFRATLLLALFAYTFAALSEEQYQISFVNWMKTHDRSYAHDQFFERYNIFKKNLDFIEEFNSKGLHQVAMNQFGDMTVEEFAALHNGFKMPSAEHLAAIETMPIEGIELPSSKDWRQDGAVTQVKNQGQCGSCWSFSTTGSIEGCHKLSGKDLVALSEKNLMDCSWSYGNMGCNGGLMTQAMQYVIANNGLDTESSYPYSPVSSHDCRFSKSSIGSTLSSFKNVQQGSESGLQEAVSKGPVSVAIDASHMSFQFYSSGVYYEPDCSSTQLDHGVLAIGWGTEDSQDYWLVKNSWGESWGLQGYIKMARNKNNNCGIATSATLPSGC